VTARPIGEILRDLPPHLAALQALLNRCHEASGKKNLVVTAALGGVISEDEASLLITANQLETA
jgi:hypothetical protein